MVMEGIKLEIFLLSLRVLFIFYILIVVGVLDMMLSVIEKFMILLLFYLLVGIKFGFLELIVLLYIIIV